MIYSVLRTKKLERASIAAPELLAAGLPAEELRCHHEGSQAPDGHHEQVPALEAAARRERVETLVHRLGEMPDREDGAPRAPPFRRAGKREADVLEEAQRQDD